MTTKYIANIISNFNFSKYHLPQYLRKHYKRIYNRILNETEYLNKFSKTGIPEEISLFERLYCILNDLSDRPLCQYCKKEYVSRFSITLNSYRKWCGPSCQASDPECITKSKQTRKEIYGYENYHGVEKAKETRYKKNNGKWHSDDYPAKVKSTKKEHFGDENWQNIEKQKETIARKLKENPNIWKEREEKTKQTKIKNGKDPNWNNREKFKETLNGFSEERRKEILSKRRNFNNDHYGYDYTIQVPEFRNNKVSYYMENFGCRTIQQTEEFKNEMKKKNLEKIGLESYLQTDECRKQTFICRRTQLYNYFIDNQFDEPMFTLDEFIHSDKLNDIFSFKCRKCGKIFTSTLGIAKCVHKRCPECYPEYSKSHKQAAVTDFIRSLSSNEFLTNTKRIIKPYELDIYIQNNNLAIEFDGLFWHSSESGKSSSYHLDKYTKCKEKNIKLIHIFEDEWDFKSDIVKSILTKNISNNKIYISNLQYTISQISEKDERDFMMKNNIFDYTVSSISFGIYVNDNIISVMSFNKMKDKNEYSIIRFCNKTFINIQDSFSILLSHFERIYHPSKISMYVDKRYFSGRSLSSLGFIEFKHTKPKMNIFNKLTLERININTFKQHLISDESLKYDKDKTLYDNIIGNNLNTIYDCGGILYLKTYI